MQSLDDVFEFLGKYDDHGLNLDRWEIPAFMAEFLKTEIEHNAAFRDALEKELTETFYNAIAEEVRDCKGPGLENANFNCILAGKQKNGKSTILTAIYIIWRDLQLKLNHIYSEIKWTFQTTETLEQFAKVADFTMLCQDEDDDLEGPDSTTIKKRMGNLIERGRASGISLCIASPTMAYIPGCDYALLPMGKDRLGIQLAKTGDFSHCFSRVMIYHKNPLSSTQTYVPLGTAIIPVGEAIQFMKEQNYFGKKMESFRLLQEQMGAAGVSREIMLRKNKPYILELIAAAQERFPMGVTKEGLKGLIWETKIPRMKDEDFIIKMAYFWMKEGKPDEPKPERKEIERSIVKTFQFDLDTAIDCVMINPPENVPRTTLYRNLQIFRTMKENPNITNQDWLDHPMKEKFSDWPTDQASFTKIARSASGYIGAAMGEYYEKYVESDEAQNSDVKKVIRDGRKNQPDIIAIQKDGCVRYISCKCFGWKGRTMTIPYDKFAPELEFAKKDLAGGNAAFCEARIFNILTNEEFRHQFNFSEVKAFRRGGKKSLTISKKS